MRSDGDVENLELDDAAGCLCVDDVTHLVAEEGLGNGGGARNFAGAEIGFAFRDDGVLHLGADLHVFHLNGGEDLDDVGAELGGVDDLGRCDGSFEFVDLGFEVSLRFFCRVVFGVSERSPLSRASAMAADAAGRSICSIRRSWATRLS